MKFTFFLLAVGLVLIPVFGVLVFVIGASPLNSRDQSLRSITIIKGATGKQIATQLEKEKVVRSGLLLWLTLRLQNRTNLIQSGTYEFSPNMSLSQVISTLNQGARDNWVTILEGWRKEQISLELETDLGVEYFDPKEFLRLASDKEGMLFPDTYLFAKQTSAQAVIATLTSTFEKRYAKLIKDLGEPTLTKMQVITLASLVEREARSPQDMRMVAGILANRLMLGMPLQVDATLQYIKGYDKTAQTWWSEPDADDKQLNSLFNTYQNKGLPPTPICNPGIEALSAALSPQASNYLFYISDRQGEMHYARTLEEHNANISRYLR